MRDAEIDGLNESARNVWSSAVAKTVSAPKVPDELSWSSCEDLPSLPRQATRLAPFTVPAMVALFTGMRLGEVLALRWSRVDLDAKVIQCAKHWSRRKRTASL